MNMFNKFYKYGSEIKAKAALYCLAIVFFISIANLCSGIITVNIITLLQAFIASGIVAIVEHLSFRNYDELSSEKKKTNTAIWAIVTNVIFIGSSVVFAWFPALPVWAIVVLLIVLEGGIIAMRYMIYIVNVADTLDLNKKLQKYQKDTKK